MLCVCVLFKFLNRGGLEQSSNTRREGGHRAETDKNEKKKKEEKIEKSANDRIENDKKCSWEEKGPSGKSEEGD